MSKPVGPIKTKICFHLGETLAGVSKARRDSLRLKLLKLYARALIKLINLGCN